MRYLAAALLLVACTDEPMLEPDAGVPPDAFDASGYGPCYSWQETSPTLKLCAAQCWNYGTVGKYALNTPDSCEIADGVYCDPKFMTAPSWHDGVGCCVYSSSPERVDFAACR